MNDAKKGVVTCVTCGVKYVVCRKCEKTSGVFQSWRMTACCPECWQISQIINQWFYKQITTEEASSRLSLIPQKFLDNANPDTQESIKSIMIKAQPDSVEESAETTIE